jgi:3-oxoacyl-[acyl-carrier-protein] synthase-3
VSAAEVRIAGVAVEEPALVRDVEWLQAQGLLKTPAAQLRESGFGTCRISHVSASELALRALRRLLEDTCTPPERVQLLVTASALPPSAIVPRADTLSMCEQPVSGLDLTRYTAARVQHEAGLEGARVLGVTELGCVALLNAVWLAHRLMDQEGWDTAVCVNADVMPRQLGREVLYSLMSDAGCAVLLRRGDVGHRMLHHAQMSKGFYWDAERCHNELLASYYPTGKRLIANALQRCGMTLDDIACVLPNNVSRRSWEVMCQVLRLPMDKVYSGNIARHGHAMASDNFINLRDALREGRVKPGDRVLLFGFGLGAHWACSVVEI